jgi:hypothetical protein
VDGRVGERLPGMVLGQVALGDEAQRLQPVGLVAVDGGGDGPDVGVGHGVAGGRGVGVGDGEGTAAGHVTEGGGRGEEAERLADYGGGVGEGVEEVWGGSEGCGGGGGRAEDGGEFVREAGLDLWVAVKEVIGVSDGRGGGVVAGEDEGLDLGDADGTEFWVDGRDGFTWFGEVFFLVGVEGKVDDRALPLGFGFGNEAVGVGLRGSMRAAVYEAMVKFFANESVKFATSKEEFERARDAQAIERINRCRRWHISEKFALHYVRGDYSIQRDSMLTETSLQLDLAHAGR